MKLRNPLVIAIFVPAAIVVVITLHAELAGNGDWSECFAGGANTDARTSMS